ncbi:hypothetical protein A3I95_01325 [Candidatus Nomurabacteria bacterium RIFCSPLOWO2_02_FULL_44_12]|uniref:MobA-like NTP transferase domain-containing protein n=1 Tax=Candidatus Nomurabacteria bacterium RIFCSPLOWO2_12_FULL_44_11 TaxID=1801796 RepID=A0A1F6Y6Y7_9BACT|nr:MAG: hypothetical protein A3E95_01495 [Candidatus Nomurabacteria bacterium RIFCSPHIGHO2_12_FULL_44_22b]OGJ02133.1 MAG: hypothetical protein A3G53_00470 [Candidatus Nomurabacteria bacterium RIFCSPLOWO2_12_FULL_44_11]OGJ08678.1 MAG: hypothetical protein A3I95_01325 [Candidatus Nomurabacteria bacterium RIFCSPLOWO2_02_FULL_44_12]
MNDKVKIVILAAGLGKRMQSENPKVLAEVRGKSMLERLSQAAQEVTGSNATAIVGHQADLIKSRFGDSLTYVIQEKQLGTGHALLVAKDELKDAEHIVVLYGDQPLITSETIKNLIKKHLDSGAKITFATTLVPDFSDWRAYFIKLGRVLRKDNKITCIREYNDAIEEERSIKEINIGCFVFNAKWLWGNLEKIENKNRQKEYYVTDLIPMAFRNGNLVEGIPINPREALGANSKEELEILEKFA